MKKHSLILALCLCAALSVFADAASEGILCYTMDNGLEVFVAENHVVPLVYIEIAVRAGAITQTPDTAGLFHLYEHMMFKGNALYPDAAAVNRALSELGVASWNGTTGVNHVNYYFTIPADKLEEGLAFWNAAIRSPLMDERELEGEKKVVLSEIEGGKADTSKVFHKYLSATLFPDAPYKTDSAGSFRVVRGATAASLRSIQEEFYVPNNAALFIGGDVSPDEAYELAKRIFGTWQRGEAQKPMLRQNPAPFDDHRYCVMPSDRVSSDLAQIMIEFRGPDADFDIEDTYATDYLMYLTDEPDGIFVRRLYESEELKIPDFNDSWASYSTVRTTGTIQFGTLVTDTETDLAARAKKLVSLIQDEVTPELVASKKLYKRAYKTRIVERVQDAHIKNTQTAAGKLKSLRSWWVNTGVDYYFDYYDRLKAVTQQDVQAVAAKYITGKSALVSVLVNPEVYERVREDFVREGFYEIQPDEPLWWEREPYASAYADEAAADDSASATPVLGDATANGTGCEAPADGEAQAAPEVSGDSGASAEDALAARDEAGDSSAGAEPATGDAGSTPAIEAVATEWGSGDIYVPRGGGSAHKAMPLRRDIEVRRLKNGIPVYFYHTDSDVVCAAIFCKGGAANLTPQTSGLETTLFSFMSKSSAKYSYETRSKFYNDTSSKIGYISKLSGTALYMTSLQKHVDKTLALFTDGFLHPTFEPDEYEAKVKDLRQRVQAILNTPDKLLAYTISDAIYKGHPYETKTYVTPLSIDNITVEAMRAHHESLLAAAGIFVVVSGNVDAKRITKTLSKTLGKIKVQRNPTSQKPIPQVTIQEEPPVVLRLASSAGTANVSRVFQSPPNSHPDFMPCVLAGQVYSDILFNVVREHYGICYTPQSYVIGSKAPYGVEHLYKVSDFEHFFGATAEARAYMERGLVVDRTNEEGAYEFSPLSDRIESYKSSYINQTYAGRQTSKDLVEHLGYNLLQFDDIDFDLKQLEQLRTTQTGDVRRVFKKYWVDAPSAWFAVTGQEETLSFSK